jgi:hypothetical protein
VALQALQALEEIGSIMCQRHKDQVLASITLQEKAHDETPASIE